jgi:RNA polymerase sigma-70 factor (ECF subfamily)
MTPAKLREKLVRFVSAKVGDRADVEDIVQETLIAIYDSLPLFRGKSSFFTWCCSIAKHEICDFYRKKKIKQIVFSRLPKLKELVSEALGPELAYQELETKKKIVATLKHLSEGYSRILRLKYVEELSMRQIANQLNLTVKAVESRLTRARLAFQKVYADQENRQVRVAPFD